MYVCALHMYLVWWRPKEGVRSHATRVIVRKAMWVLGPLEPKFSGRADSVLIHWIISPVNRKIYSQIYYFPILGFWILIVSKCSQVSRAKGFLSCETTPYDTTIVYTSYCTFVHTKCLIPRMSCKVNYEQQCANPNHDGCTTITWMSRKSRRTMLWPWNCSRHSSILKKISPTRGLVLLL